MSKLYEIRDRIGKTTLNIVIAESDGQAVRDNMPNFWRFIPKDDVELYEIGEFDRSTGTGDIGGGKRKVDIEYAYKFPETIAKNESKDVNSDIQAMQKISAEIEANADKQAAAASRNMDITKA